MRKDSFICIIGLVQWGMHTLIISSPSAAPTWWREIPAAWVGEGNMGCRTRHLDLNLPFACCVVFASSLTLHLVSSSGKWGRLLPSHKAISRGGAIRRFPWVLLTLKLQLTICWKNVRYGGFNSFCLSRPSWCEGLTKETILKLLVWHLCGAGEDHYRPSPILLTERANYGQRTTEEGVWCRPFGKR